MRRYLQGFAALVWILTTLGCGADDGGAAPDAGEVDAGPDPSDALFEADHIVEVEVELPAASWDALRLETRSILDVLGGDCLAQPFESPFNWYQGSATIDGVHFDNVGVKKKGFLGSLDEVKPSFKVKLDEYVAGQDLLGMDKLTFNNSKQDPAFVRQCLSYGVFRAAGIEAPRCNFAHVVVNGDDLGLFVHVESPDKDFVERRFAEDAGNLFEGTLSDFRPGFVGTFDLKTNELAPDRSDLDEVVAALELPDDQLLAALDPLIDVDDYLTFWASEVLTGHWDGYASNTNNFFVYDDPADGRFRFIPWGTDGTFQANPLTADAPPPSVFASGLLARRLYLLPETQGRYLDRLNQLLDTVWDESALDAELARMEDLITPIADPDGAIGLHDQIASVRDVVDAQRGLIDDSLADGPPVWDLPLRDPLCLTPRGTLDATFSTTFGTLGDPNPFATGTGTYSQTVDGITPLAMQVGATAGPDPDQSQGPRSQIQVVALLDDNTVAVAFAQIPDGSFAAGTLPVDWTQVFGGLYRYDPATDTAALVAIFGGGTLRLDAASRVVGQPVTGQLTVDLVDWPF